MAIPVIMPRQGQSVESCIITKWNKKVGDTVEFGGLLGYAPVMPVNSFDCSAFINRGGRLPAPIHSFKN